MDEYIDRNALIEHMKKDPLFDLVEQYGVTDVIESFPAADVQPVKHGRWENGVTFHKVCSECNCIIEDPAFDEVFFGCGRLNYCPNCGARMDGET